MATTATYAQGTRSSAVLALGTLASATYVTSSAIDLGATIPMDVTFEMECDPNGTPSGNKQLILFAKLSLDGTNYSDSPDQIKRIDKATDPHQTAMKVIGVPHFIVTMTQTGSTDSHDVRCYCQRFEVISA